jgi:hypothetical protein
VVNTRSKHRCMLHAHSLPRHNDDLLTRISLLIDYAHGSPQMLQSPPVLQSPLAMQPPQFPPTPQSAHAQTSFINDFNSPYSHHHMQQNPKLPRGSSETAFPTNTTPKPGLQTMPRTSSDVIQQPKPLPVGPFQGPPGRGRVQWNLGSEG